MLNEKLLPKNRLTDWLREMESRYTLLGPVEGADGPPEFRRVTADCELVLNNRRFAVSPKEAVLPRCETLFKVDPGKPEPEISTALGESAPALLMGLKPCDMRSLEVLDKVFLDGRFQDPYYARRREKLVTAAYVCESKRWSCFCSSVGDPVEWAAVADVCLTDVGDAYVFTANTPAGESLIAGAAFEDVPPEAKERRDQVHEALRSAEASYPSADVAARVDWDEPSWEAIAEKCLGCGVCSYMCPTCTCFDIQDETGPGNVVERYRVRDTCQFCDFTKMGHGHNPRPGRTERARQRVSHKFRYIFQQCGILGCVGCGRCVELCPVNVDLRKVLLEIVRNNERESVSA